MHCTPCPRLSAVHTNVHEYSILADEGEDLNSSHLKEQAGRVVLHLARAMVAWIHDYEGQRATSTVLMMAICF